MVNRAEPASGSPQLRTRSTPGQRRGVPGQPVQELPDGGLRPFDLGKHPVGIVADQAAEGSAQ